MAVVEQNAAGGNLLVLGGKLLTQMGVLRSAAQQAGYGKRDLQAGAGYDVTSNMCGSKDVMWRTMPLRPSRQCRERRQRSAPLRLRLHQNECGLESECGLAAS